MVEFLTGFAFWLAAISDLPFLSQCLVAAFLAVLVLILVYDLAHTIIPNELVFGLLIISSFFVGYDVYIEGIPLDFLWSLIAGLSAAGPFVFLWVISQGRWIGLGDAKLAFPLGMMVGIYGVVSLVIVSFWLGAAISLVLIGVQKLLKRGQIDLRITGRALTMKSEIPFAPFLILSFLTIFMFKIDAFSLLSYVI
jgi:prepilin signal peptidase PulO-like enzyme (type II secretory pathway)